MISLAALFLWLSVAFCLSMTAGGFLVLFRFRRTAVGPSLPYLQVFFILINVFGYYSLWSNILLSDVFAIDHAIATAQVVALLGTPFFLLGLVMLLLWACTLQQRPVGLMLAGALTFSLLSSVLIWWTGLPTHDPVRGIWSICGLLFYAAVLAQLALGKPAAIAPNSAFALQGLLAFSALIHASYFTPLPLLSMYEIVFADLFFLGNAALVVLYVYRAPRPSTAGPSGLEALFERYGISKREGDIVREIYAGKTNQEIANTLFLSVQTVKDHCSRIYQKTFVKNRGQLMALVRESKTQV